MNDQPPGEGSGRGPRQQFGVGQPDRTVGAEYDVVVVGAGLAGHAAALTASQSGATVCLLEKGDDYGGSSARSGGGLAFAGTDLQRSAGIDDSGDALRADLLRTGGGVARPELVDAYVDNQLETYEWLNSCGIKFSLEQPAVPGTLTRIHLSGRGLATRVLHERVEADDRVAYVAGVHVHRLHRSDGHRVDAALLRVGDVDQVVHARRSIVLTTGGFARSEPLLRAFAPQWVGAVPMSGEHTTGDGMTMAWALGAGLADLPYVAASFGASLPTPDGEGETEPILLYPNYRGAIIVNRQGRRFTDEDQNYKTLSRICIDQPGAITFEIFDEPIFQQSDDRAVPMDYKSAFAAGLVQRADSLQELAASVGIDAAALCSTVDRYNQLVTDGQDSDFGRSIKYRDNAGGGLIATPPYYCYPTRPGLTTTYAGIVIDGAMKVLDVFGAGIDGLYAAGETVGGFHGAGYVSGTGLGKAAVFGRIAGREAGRP